MRHKDRHLDIEKRKLIRLIRYQISRRATLSKTFSQTKSDTQFEWSCVEWNDSASDQPAIYKNDASLLLRCSWLDRMAPEYAPHTLSIINSNNPSSHRPIITINLLIYQFIQSVSQSVLTIISSRNGRHLEGYIFARIHALCTATWTLYESINQSKWFFQCLIRDPTIGGPDDIYIKLTRVTWKKVL